MSFFRGRQPPVVVLIAVLILGRLLRLPLVQGSVTILDATKLKTASDVSNYDHQVILENNADDELDDVLIFRWDDPSDGVLNASLEHTTKNENAKPSWLALGFFDELRNTVPIFDEILDQVNGQAVVGTLFFANPSVFKYSLGYPHGRPNEPNGGVSIMPDAQQTLIFENVEQGTIKLDDGSEALRTVLMFAKNMDEAKATGNADLKEALIRETGDNIFTWAIGPAGMETLGMHDRRGAFRLEFASAPATTTSASTSAASTTAPATSTSINIVNGTNVAKPIGQGPENAPYREFDHQVQLDDNLFFYWKDPGNDAMLKARVEHRATSTATAPSWLSFGFYHIPHNPKPVTSENFVLDKSTAIIGTFWDEDKAPLHYTLGYNHAEAGVIQPLAEQNLVEADFLQFTNTATGQAYTTLSFSKSMRNQSPNEPPIIAVGDNLFMWAMGPPGATSLGMHSEYGAFRLDLMAAAQVSNHAVEEILVVDGTVQAITSVDAKFDFQVQLENDVIFRWEVPDQETGIFTGRLEHTTRFVEAAPAWLGFGFPNPTDTSTWMLMQNTYAIIGLLPSEKVEKYSLGVNNNHTNGFVEALPLEQQTLKASKMMQSHDPDTGIYTTTLTFAKLLVEQNTLESPLWVQGENRFLWAVGNALTATPTLGMHRDFGALTVDFAKVETRIDGPRPVSTPPPSPRPQTPAPQPQTQVGGTGEPAYEVDPYPAPVIVGQCSSTVFEKSGKSIQLTPDLSMHWTLNDVADAEYAEFGEVPSLTVVLEYAGKAWIGFGISKASQAHSIHSTSIIGIPPTKDSPQLKYNISALTVDGIVPMADQTLIESYVNQAGGNPGLTTLRFTKALKDGLREVDIRAKGLNFFSFAVGAGNKMGYHRHRGSFQMDLSECYDLPPGYDYSAQNEGDTKKSNHAKGALTAHAVMAALAWGFSMPCAVGMAWFRQLIPTTWIYVHVSFNLLTFLLTLMAVLVGVAAVSSRDNSSHFSKAHHIVGVLLFLAYTFQIGNGFLRPPVARKEDGTPVERRPFSMTKPDSAREWWHLIHRSTGIIMLLVGVFQIASGMKLFDENFESGRDNFFWYWTYVSMFCLTLLALKIWLITQNRRARGEAASWVEDRAATSVGIEPRHHRSSDPSGMDTNGDCVVLEIPSRSGNDSTMIRGSRRAQSGPEDYGGPQDYENSERTDDDNMTVEIT